MRDELHIVYTAQILKVISMMNKIRYTTDLQRCGKALTALNERIAKPYRRYTEISIYLLVLYYK